MAELREAIERERRVFRDLWQPPAGLDRDDAKAKKAAIRRIDALVRKLGTTSARLRALGAEYDTRLLKVLSKIDGRVTHALLDSCPPSPASCRSTSMSNVSQGSTS